MSIPTTRGSNDDVVTLLHVVTEFIASVEVHVTAMLDAREEWAVVFLEVAATIIWLPIGCITAEGALESAIWKCYYLCPWSLVLAASNSWNLVPTLVFVKVMDFD